MAMTIRRWSAVTAVAGAYFVAFAASAQLLKQGDDALRPLYAQASDIAEGKDLATSSCAKCHGGDGIATDRLTPNLAGQRPAYLYLELKAYQAGARSNADMTEKVKFLSDDAIVKVAAYYASLDPAQPPQSTPPELDDPVAAGKAAAATCAQCHGDNGVSHKAGVPNLIGQDAKYLVETMQSYVSGDRPTDETNQKMKTALDGFKHKDFANVALFYALQKDGLTRAQTPAQGDAAVSKDSLARCVKCHGADGVGVSPSPSLAGQDWTYLVKALHAYKDDTRDDDTMGPKAKKLDDDDIKNLAAYYSSLTPKPTGIARPLTPDQWADKCDRCHGANGNSTRLEVPALAAQRLDYLEKVLHEYQSGVRKSTAMAAMSSVLSDDDVEGLAIHYAFAKARAAIFVPVPSK